MVHDCNKNEKELEAYSLILNDKFEQAKEVISTLPESPLTRLFNSIPEHIPLIPERVIPSPAEVIIGNSHICHSRCRMCMMGFRDKSEICEEQKLSFDNYKKSPYYSPYIEKAEWVELCGSGEPLLAPDTMNYLEEFSEKKVRLFTSGMPLNEEMMEMLIRKKLDVITFSFDGSSAFGHGQGRKAYEKKFWKIIDRFNDVKKTLRKKNPDFKLAYTITPGNIDSLKPVILQAEKKGFTTIFITPMVPFLNETFNETYTHSIYMDYQKYWAKIMDIIKKAREETSLKIVPYNEKYEPLMCNRCDFLDQSIIFSSIYNHMSVCCGALTMPHMILASDPLCYTNSFPFRYLRNLHAQPHEMFLPQGCRECLLTNDENRFEGFKSRVERMKYEREKAWEPHIIEGMIKKNEKNYQEARKCFNEAMKYLDSGEAKGRTAFHLCEIALEEGDEKQALYYAEMSVRNFFSHLKAFTCLYLLMQKRHLSL